VHIIATSARWEAQTSYRRPDDTKATMLGKAGLLGRVRSD
jgi:hypothetical protein